MGILLALLLGASSPCCDGKCPVPTANVCENGECGDKKCDAGCSDCKCSDCKCSAKSNVKAKAKPKLIASRKPVRSFRQRLFRRR